MGPNLMGLFRAHPQTSPHINLTSDPHVLVRQFLQPFPSSPLFHFLPPILSDPVDRPTKFESPMDRRKDSDLDPDRYPDPADSEPFLGAHSTPPPDAGSSRELRPLRRSLEIREGGENEEEGKEDNDDDDIEAASAPCCRICLECDDEPGEELISPCMCKGTQQFVHRSCLDHWRSVKEGFAFSHCTTCRAQFHLRVEYPDYSWHKIKFRIFVARDVLLVFLAVQSAIATIGGFAYILDRSGSFRNSFDDGWDRVLSKHPIPFYYCLGVLIFFVFIGFFGLILHCSSLNNNDPCMAGCRNCCYGWEIVDCFPASMELCFALVVIFVIVFAILGIAYGFLAATMAIQRIWQRHYHILTKKELTKEYVVEDLRGCYSTPKLDPEHEQRLKMLKLM